MYLSKLHGWEKIELCNKCSEVAIGKNFLTFLSDCGHVSGLLVCDARMRQKAGLLPLSAFCALFVSTARTILGHPGVAAFRKTAKKDAFLKGS